MTKALFPIYVFQLITRKTCFPIANFIPSSSHKTSRENMAKRLVQIAVVYMDHLLIITIQTKSRFFFKS